MKKSHHYQYKTKPIRVLCPEKEKVSKINNALPLKTTDQSIHFI